MKTLYRLTAVLGIFICFNLLSIIYSIIRGPNNQITCYFFTYNNGNNNSKWEFEVAYLVQVKLVYPLLPIEQEFRSVGFCRHGRGV